MTSTPSAIDELAGEGAVGAKTIEELIAKLEPPRSIWVMVPAAFTEDTVKKLAAHAQPDDAIIDGGNSYYHDDIRRAKMMKEHGMHYVDVGTSGGVFGLERGYCLMIGGDDIAVAAARPDLPRARAWPRQRRADAGARGRPDPRRARLPALRQVRRRPFREDGPQRDRVRDHGRLCGGDEHPPPRRHRLTDDRAGRRDGADRERAGVLLTTTSTCPRSPRSGVVAR